MSHRSVRPWASLRGRFLLVIVLGMALPMTLLGPWLARTTRAFGEEMLRARLEASLAEVANAVGHRWLEHRSTLLHLAESPAVVSALLGGPGLAAATDGAAPADLQQAWHALQGVAEGLTVRDAQGVVRGALEREGSSSGSESTPGSSTIPARLPVYEPGTGKRIGSLEARLRLGSLLPAGVWWAGVGGSVLALFDEAGGIPLAPLSMSPELFARDRFEWGNDEWLVVRRQLHEPALSFALAAPVGPIIQPFSRAARQSTVALIAVLLAGLALSVLLTRRVTGPLERLAMAADDVAQGRLERQVAEQGPDELRRLGRAFNTMTASLRELLRRLSQQEAVAAVGEFAALLAHEVRNPLTSIRLDLERARERLDDPRRAGELLDRAVAEIDRLDAAVNGSLRIARSGSLAFSPTDLRQPLRAAMHAAEPAFAARGARLEDMEAPAGSVVVRGNAGALEQLFLNLLLNAAEALHKGGSARVSVEPAGGAVSVRIRDDGQGISPDQLERILEPFYTTKEAGTGLGLPIAHRIAHAHGGDLRLESSPGVGTTVTVTLSCAPAHPLTP